ncbi:MAG: hypothetical protein AAGE59_03995 [Cyanobacteria bacterium P01_F01_bin.86]
MRSRKAQKIDLQAEYPCPCHRNGKLSPIALTEAFGCYRCQRIFVVREDGYLLEQLSTHHPYKQVWYWTGQKWQSIHSALFNQYLPLIIILLIVVVLMLLLASLRPPPSLNKLLLPLLLLAVMALLCSLIFWLSCRR